MRSRHPDGPRNPVEPVEITPEEYEWQVRDWLREREGEPTDIEVGHLEKIAGSGGEYEFDVVAHFTRFSEAQFTVLLARAAGLRAHPSLGALRRPRGPAGRRDGRVGGDTLP